MSTGTTPDSFGFSAPVGPSPNPAAPSGYGMGGTYKLVKLVPGSEQAEYKFTSNGAYSLSGHQTASNPNGALNGGPRKGEAF